MRLPDSYRSRLKKPMGVLIPDRHTTRERISKEIPDGSYIVSVGDRTTEKMIALGMVPSLQITDGLEKRARRPHPELAEPAGRGDDGHASGAGGACSCGDCSADAAASNAPHTTVIDVVNPPAEITRESIDAIRRAFAADPPVRIRVDGEEDLLVIPSCVYAPGNTAVLYGQPDEGLVVTPVTDEIRNKTRGIMSHMG